MDTNNQSHTQTIDDMLSDGAVIAYDSSNFSFDDSKNIYIKVIKYKEKRNFVSSNNTLLSPIWFDWHFFTTENCILVQYKGKYNYLMLNGTFLLSHWYDYVDIFQDKIAIVADHIKGYNFIDLNGNFISDIWFFNVNPFLGGEGIVFLNPDSKYLIDTSGNLKYYRSIYD